MFKLLELETDRPECAIKSAFQGFNTVTIRYRSWDKLNLHVIRRVSSSFLALRSIKMKEVLDTLG